jgi:hypothetical protein
MDIRVQDRASWWSLVGTRGKQDLMTAPIKGVTFDKTIESFVDLSKFLSTTIASRCVMVHDLVYDAFYTNAIKTRSVDQVKQILKDCSEYLARNH